MRRNLARDIPWTVIAILSLASCTLYEYDPVEERSIERLVEDGCEKGDRVTTTAEVNQVYEDSVVLWDGRDPDTTYTLRFKGPGLGAKTKSLLGENRYESAYKALSHQMEEDEPVDVSFVCQGRRKTPVANRFSFRDEDGEEIAYEF
jgi:hypothetical protein